MEAKGIKHITVVGAGTMGHRIGQEFARAGYDVILRDCKDEILAQAKDKIRRNLQQMAEWQLISASDIQPIVNRMRFTTSLEEAAGNADLVVEAVVEDLALKQEVFRELDQVCPERTILASNTSSLMPSALASATQRPDRVLVAHFVYPPHLMPLVEIVRSPATSEETVQAVCGVLRAAGKHPVILQKEAIGFIINRLQIALFHEALTIVDRGIASAQDVDIAVKESFGRRMAVAGPFEMIEIMDGWDALLKVMNYILPDLNASREPTSLIRKMVKEGKLGAKRGSDGFYEWPPEAADAWSEKLESFLAEFARRDIVP